VVGIDLAGTESRPLESDPILIERYAALFQRAREAGLKVTIHTGETKSTGPQGGAQAIRRLKPHRIGHGIQSAWSEETMKLLREEGITLEICPSSNLWCRTAESTEQLKWILGRFHEHKVRYTICTDGTYLLKTDLMNEYRLLHEKKILTPEQINTASRTAWEASFLRNARP